MSDLLPRPARLRSTTDFEDHVPVHVVWEITLACNLKCQHCGSRAGKARKDELSTEECFAVIDQLAKLGTRELTLIGGEAFLRPDWILLIDRITKHGMYCAIQTGALHLTEERLQQAISAGLKGIGISIDGTPGFHDRIRGVPGAYAMAIDALERARAADLNRSVNTQIGPETIAMLPELMDAIIAAGAKQWQLQLTVAMGNAVDNDHLLLQPYQLLELMPLLADLADTANSRGLQLIIGNNIGYFGPYEAKLRAFSESLTHWSGCSAGHTVMGLEADGTVKGCPSLPRAGYAGGNVKDLTIEQIWRESEDIHFGRLRSVDDLWGFCRSCYYADACRGGCTWTSHSLLGKPGNNPYCHYRALKLDRMGLRERIHKVKGAPLDPFSIGEFELLLERKPGADSGDGSGEIKPPADASQPPPRLKSPERSKDAKGRVPKRLEPCGSCHQYVYPEETTCPHCQTNLAEARMAHAERLQTAKALAARLQGLLRPPVSPL
jgi:Y-X(10)_GDL-associated radical SAM protein